MSKTIQAEYPTDCTISNCSNNRNLPARDFTYFCPSCYDALMRYHQPRLTARPLSICGSDSETEVNVDLILGLHEKAPQGLGMVEPISSSGKRRLGLSKKCDKCLKRVGLAGFSCRCERHFCSEHRHAEKHECTFDYKTFEREELSRQNPLVAGQKIVAL